MIVNYFSVTHDSILRILSQWTPNTTLHKHTNSANKMIFLWRPYSLLMWSFKMILKQF